MVAFFRRFLVVLLVLLQNAAPLVHAHTGGDVSQGGFHLYEFEALRFVADQVSMVSAGHGQDTESCIVNVGSAIKQHQTSNDPIPVFCLLGGNPVASANRYAETVNFSTHLAGFVPQSFPNHNTTRAPPL